MANYNGFLNAVREVRNSAEWQNARPMQRRKFIEKVKEIGNAIRAEEEERTINNAVVDIQKEEREELRQKRNLRKDPIGAFLNKTGLRSLSEEWQGRSFSDNEWKAMQLLDDEQLATVRAIEDTNKTAERNGDKPRATIKGIDSNGIDWSYEWNGTVYEDLFKHNLSRRKQQLGLETDTEERTTSKELKKLLKNQSEAEAEQEKKDALKYGNDSTKEFLKWVPNQTIRTTGDFIKGAAEHTVLDPMYLAGLGLQTVGAKDSARGVIELAEKGRENFEHYMTLGNAEWNNKDLDKDASIWEHITTTDFEHAIDSTLGTAADLAALLRSPMNKMAQKYLGAGYKAYEKGKVVSKTTKAGQYIDRFSKWLIGSDNAVVGKGIIGGAKEGYNLIKSGNTWRWVKSLARGGAGKVVASLPTTVGMSLSEMYSDLIDRDNLGNVVLPDSTMPVWMLAPIHGTVEHLGIDPRSAVTKGTRKAILPFLKDLLNPMRMMGEGFEEVTQDSLSVLAKALSFNTEHYFDGKTGQWVDTGKPNTVFGGLAEGFSALSNDSKKGELLKTFVLSSLATAFVPEGGIKSSTLINQQKQRLQEATPFIDNLLGKELGILEKEADRQDAIQNIEKHIEGEDLDILSNKTSLKEKQQIAKDKLTDQQQIENIKNTSAKEEQTRQYVEDLNFLIGEYFNSQQEDGTETSEAMSLQEFLAPYLANKENLAEVQDQLRNKVEETKTNKKESKKETKESGTQKAENNEEQFLNEWNSLGEEEQAKYKDVNEYIARRLDSEEKTDSKEQKEDKQPEENEQSKTYQERLRDELADQKEKLNEAVKKKDFKAAKKIKENIKDLEEQIQDSVKATEDLNKKLEEIKQEKKTNISAFRDRLNSIIEKRKKQEESSRNNEKEEVQTDKEDLVSKAIDNMEGEVQDNAVDYYDVDSSEEELDTLYNNLSDLKKTADELTKNYDNLSDEQKKETDALLADLEKEVKKTIRRIESVSPSVNSDEILWSFDITEDDDDDDDDDSSNGGVVETENTNDKDKNEEKLVAVAKALGIDTSSLNIKTDIDNTKATRQQNIGETKQKQNNSRMSFADRETKNTGIRNNRQNVNDIQLGDDFYNKKDEGLIFSEEEINNPELITYSDEEISAIAKELENLTPEQANELFKLSNDNTTNEETETKPEQKEDVKAEKDQVKNEEKFFRNKSLREEYEHDISTNPSLKNMSYEEWLDDSINIVNQWTLSDKKTKILNRLKREKSFVKKHNDEAKKAYEEIKKEYENTKNRLEELNEKADARLKIPTFEEHINENIEKAEKFANKKGDSLESKARFQKRLDKLKLARDYYNSINKERTESKPTETQNKANKPETVKLSSPLEITDEDFTNPTRSIELPPLPDSTLELMKAEKKPILLKQNIFVKNLTNHKELSPKQSREILNNALYNSDLIGQSKATSKPTYWVAVKLGDKNAVVVIDLTETKDNHEIVGWRLIDEKGFERMKRQAEKEGGQFLITKDENTQGAAALSALQSGLSNESIPTNSENVKSDGKVTEQEILDLFKKNNDQLKARTHTFYLTKNRRITIDYNQSYPSYSLEEFVDSVNNSEDSMFDFFRQDIIKKSRAEAEKAKEQEKPKEDSNNSTSTKIDDFGEKIGGARKDLYVNKVNEQLNKPIADADIAQKNFTEIFPDFNYESLKKEGITEDVLTALKVIRDISYSIVSHAKKYSLTGYKQIAETINNFRTIASKYIREKTVDERLMNQKDFKEVYDLYKAIGFDNIDSTVLRELQRKNLTNAQARVNGVMKDVKREYIVRRGKVRIYAYGENEEEARNEFLRQYKEQVLSKGNESQNIKFDIYKSGLVYFIGKKVSWNGKKLYKFSKEFNTAKEAREYKENHYDEIFNEYETERKERNAPPEPYEKTATERIGEDYRNGEDVTPEKFAETFGFRGVEFGNYVEGKRRQQDLNQAYDALMDLANLLGIDPKALSLNGELGLAFGARGRGGKNAAMAHYEPGNRVINLTKGKGAGTIAHEWWHGLMNYFTGFQIEIGPDMKAHGKDSSDLADHEYHRKKYAVRNAYFRQQETVRPDNMNVEAFDALVQLLTVINDDTKIIERSSDYNTSNNNYWTSTREVTARAFDNYIKYKLNQQEKNNSFLSMASFTSDVNPTLEEMPKLAEAYDKFFKSLKQEKSERKGKETIKLYSFVDPFTFLWLNRKYIAKGLKKTYNILKEGVELFGKGVKSISQWAKSMYDRFGKSINKFYKDIHKDIKAVFGKNNYYANNSRKIVVGKNLAEKIIKFIDELKGVNLNSEQKGIYNVFTAKERQYKITDLNSVNDYVLLESGNRKFGMKHILIKHYDSDILPVTANDIINIGEVIRKGKVVQDKDGRVYTLTNSNGKSLKAVVKVNKDGENTVITFHSQKSSSNAGHSGTSALQGTAFNNIINNSFQNVNNTHNGRVYSVEYLIAETATKIIKWGYEKAEDVAKKLAKYMYDTYTKIKDAYGKVKYSQWSNLVNDISDEHKKEIFKDIEKDIKKEENKKKNYKPIPSDQYEFDAYLEREWEKQPKRISDKNVVQLSSEETYNKGVEEGKRQAKAESDKVKEQVKTAAKIAKLAKNKEKGKQYLEQQAKINKAIEEARKPKPLSFKQKIEAWENWLAQKFADRRNRLAEFQKDIETAIGHALEDYKNPLRQLDTIDGRIQQKIAGFNEKYFKPLYDFLIKNGISYEDFNKFTYAMHAQERDDYIKEINPTFRDNNVRGSGWNDTEMGGTTDEVKKKLFAKYGEDKLMQAGEMFWKMNRAVIDLQEDYKLIDHQTAENIRNRYQHYTPLKHIADDEITTKVVERALGRTSTATDNLMFAASAIDTTIRWGERNNAKLAMLNLANLYKTPLVEVNRKKLEQYFDPKTGEVELRLDRKLDENTIFVKSGNATYHITFNDADLYKAFTSSKEKTGFFGSVVNFSRLFTNMMGFVSTVANPDFGIANFVRDQQQSGFENSVFRGGKFAGNSLVNAFKSMLTYREYVKGVDNEDTRLFKEFLESGGMTGYADMMSLKRRAENLEKAINEDIEASKSLNGKAKKLLKHPSNIIHGLFGIFESFNDMLESATRFGVYREKRKTSTALEAAELSKNITINFNRHGEIWDSDANAIYLFSNASIQGTRKAYQAFKQATKTKKGRIMLGSLVAAGFASEILGQLFAGFDPDDKESYYDKLEDYKKDGNIILFYGGNKYSSVPLSPALAVPYMAGRNLAACATGKKTLTQAFGDMFSNFITTLNPLGEHYSLLGTITPTVFRPALEMGTNKKWYGGPIKPEQPQRGAKKPEHKLYFEKKTAGAFVWFAKWLSDITGGDEYKGGAIDWSPSTMQYVVEQIAGGLGKSINKWYKLGTNQYGNWKDTPWEEVPMVRRFVGETNDYGTAKLYKENQQTSNLFTKIKNEKNTDYLKAHPEYKKIHNIISVADKRIDSIRDKVNMTESDKEVAITKIQKMANMAIRNLEK